MTKGREVDVQLIDGCPCNFWSVWNCRYTRAVGVCRYRGPEPEELQVLAALERAHEEARRLPATMAP